MERLSFAIDAGFHTMNRTNSSADTRQSAKPVGVRHVIRHQHCASPRRGTFFRPHDPDLKHRVRQEPEQKPHQKFRSPA